MEQKILVLSGKMQSGKTTASNFLHGFEMKRNDQIKTFDIDDEGNLLVNALTVDEQGNEIEGMGVLDVNRGDTDFVRYASRVIWPYVKVYNFADNLKEIAMNVFGLSYTQCYGTQENKGSLTEVKWENIKRFLPESQSKKTGFMTSREVLQYFGTEICRKIKPNCWAESCFRQIIDEGSQLAIIADCRFPDEADFSRKMGAKVIRLTLDPFHSTHESETALDDYKDFDYVLDNSELDLHHKNGLLIKKLIEWGWVSA